MSNTEDTWEAALEAVREVLAAMHDRALGQAQACSPAATGDAYSVHNETMAVGEYAGINRAYVAVSNMLHDFRTAAKLGAA